MMRVFLDTNILLDYGNQRKEGLYASIIIENGRKGVYELCASYLSFANIGYILRKMERSTKYEVIRKMRQGITILSADGDQIDAGLSKEVDDFEDMLQYQCAIAAGCDVIITNNKRDFEEFCEIPFLTAEEFLIEFDADGGVFPFNQ